MAKTSSVMKGQQFREPQARLWGNLAQVWIVEAVFAGADGVEYARLACAGEPSLRKTLSTAVLRDKLRFGHAEGTS